MDDPNAIRMLEVPHDDICKANVSNFVRIFSGIAQQPEEARRLRGKIVVSFKSYDADPRPNWAIPQIRSFIQALDKAIPYFPYFLVSDPALGYILFYLLCLVPFENLENRLYCSADLLAVSMEKTAAVTEFCKQLNDDPERATEPMLLNLPAEVVKTVPDLAERVLDGMAPMLRAIESDLGRPTMTAQERDFIQNLLSRAAEISGIDRSQYGSDRLLLRALLPRVDKVSDDAIQQFQKSFDECIEGRGGGKLKVSAKKLRQVIRQQRRAAYRFVEIHLVMAASQPGYLQPAAIVAAGLMVEFDDPGPMRRVEEKASELGAKPEQWMPGSIARP